MRLLILHELAHAWMDRYVDEPRRQAFLARMGLEGWYATGLAWGLRGVEQAAQVIAWGLMDEPIRTTRLGDRSCGELAAAFELLTDVAPLRAPCSPTRFRGNPKMRTFAELLIDAEEEPALRACWWGC